MMRFPYKTCFSVSDQVTKPIVLMELMLELRREKFLRSSLWVSVFSITISVFVSNFDNFSLKVILFSPFELFSELTVLTVLDRRIARLPLRLKVRMITK